MRNLSDFILAGTAMTFADVAPAFAVIASILVIFNQGFDLYRKLK